MNAVAKGSLHDAMRVVRNQNPRPIIFLRNNSDQIEPRTGYYFADKEPMLDEEQNVDRIELKITY